jgi:hypothetical protein
MLAAITSFRFASKNTPALIHHTIEAVYQFPFALPPNLNRRQLRDVGRSVSAFGFWADILNGPYHAFGTVADDARLFKVTNKQFVHTAVDVAERNLLVSCCKSDRDPRSACRCMLCS